MATRRSSVFDNVDPGLSRAIEEVSRGYKKYRAVPFSGNRPRPKNPSSLHPQGNAIDVNLYDPTSGALLPNIGDPSSAAAYQAYANEVYKWALQNDPELAKQLVWGGYFQGGGWPQDYMHFQRGGTQPAGGSWAGGFNPDVMQKLGLKESGGLGEMAASMQQAGYTPQQIRDAIAAIESSGEKDPYRALGKEVNRQGDRALGRYQVMASNLPQWSKQALGREYTVDEFLADPAAQDKLFDTIFGADVEKYGHRGAASKWFTGSPNEPNTTDIHGKLTGKTYADTFMEQLGRASGTPVATAANAAKSADDPYGKVVAETLADKPKKKSAGLAKALMDNPFEMSGGGYQTNLVAPAAPAALAQSGPTSMVNPQQVEQRRAALAAIMQRLNSGSLA